MIIRSQDKMSIINFDNIDVAVEEVIKFHKSAMEGAIKC
jgi:hypothetical protein